MPNPQVQTFTFSPPTPGVSPMTLSSMVTNVPMDGSASITVPYLVVFAAAVQSLTVTYNGGGYTLTIHTTPISPATTVATSLGGFVLTVSGAPAGTFGTFSYQAVGV